MLLGKSKQYKTNNFSSYWWQTYKQGLWRKLIKLLKDYQLSYTLSAQDYLVDKLNLKMNLFKEIFKTTLPTSDLNKCFHARFLNM